MSTSAVIMMLVAMLILWGGLALAIVNVVRTPTEDIEEIRRDL